jgi:hypothetical protein
MAAEVLSMSIVERERSHLVRQTQEKQLPHRHDRAASGAAGRPCSRDDKCDRIRPLATRPLRGHHDQPVGSDAQTKMADGTGRLLTGVMATRPVLHDRSGHDA